MVRNGQNYIDLNKEVDLSLLKNFLLRNKNHLIKYSFAFFLLFCSYSLTLKRVWEGRFEIFIDSNSESDLLRGSLNSSIASNIQLPSSSFNLQNKTLLNEIGILESQSVLLPVFNLLNIKKQKIDPSYKAQDFFQWKKKNFGTQLKYNTSILKVSYRDTNKKLIIPVLKDISSAYQEYSGKNKRRNFQLKQNYLDSQIEFYKVKSNNSFINTQEFAFDQDLMIFGSDGTRNNVGIEAERVKAANKIRFLDAKIKEFEKVIDIDEIIYLNSQIPSIIESKLIQKLETLDQNLFELKYKYKESDIAIQAILKERQILVDLIKKRAIGLLKGEKLETKAILDASTRPKGVILKYKELIREAARDENTLVNLENLKRVTTLDESIIEDPWQLITEPYLDRLPVAPSRTKYRFSGLIIGLFFGLFVCYLKEKRSGLIYESKILESIFKTKVLDKVEISSVKNHDLLINEILKTNKIQNIRLLADESLEINQLEKINELLIKKGYKISNNKLLNNFKEDEELILVAKLGQSSYLDLVEISNKLDLLEKKLFGLILIN